MPLFAQVGIGTTTPSIQTMLDITSSTKGFLMPRLSSAERDANLADNDPLTVYPDNTPVLDPIPGPTDYLVEGTMFFNTDINKMQYWDAVNFVWISLKADSAVGNEGSVLMNFPAFGDVGAVKFNLLEELQYEYSWTVSRIDYTGGAATTIPNFNFVLVESTFGPFVKIAFNEADFDLGPSPVTSWPENAPDTTKSGIWDETNNTILENPIEGQVHFWRLVIEYSNDDDDGLIEAVISNPNPLSSFSTSNSSVFVDTETFNTDIETATFIFITIADSFSLPSSLNGGTGYEISFRADEDVTISIRSILRISMFKD
ncbi:MAG: hypothetical protein COB12_07105 [Flavobacterium sp.]|nr:MAG: hypothetical protein COB12_07105 [Flavobacterium sp.]